MGLHHQRACIRLLVLHLLSIAAMSRQQEATAFNLLVCGGAMVYFLVASLSIHVLGSSRRVLSVWLYAYLSITFCVRFFLTEWMFGRAVVAAHAGRAGNVHVRGCGSVAEAVLVMAAYLLHLVGVESIAATAGARIEKRLDKVHHVAWLVWIHVGSPVGALSALVGCFNLLKAINALNDYENVFMFEIALYCTMGVLAVSLLWLMVRLMKFIKDMFFVIRVYWVLSDVDLMLDLSQDDHSEVYDDKDEFVV
ncbi:hypothetical protein BCR33DRAFT_847459 [Rhizoclosmatium globosum]|uniref:Uncharacterized protein n=1 Tax=Rhizoclosmatium globosum TaxID=329046 RepID=A0A1Y2CR33_9FUNG|nr:hypothetical protein BCR33DRAFT_847459 [Rhizoclosmatium globosum]|eukprot:ORY49498.1 hypothetical protein BCR33DRAFT_847459 [Rhizoclosmatium globosum]